MKKAPVLLLWLFLLIFMVASFYISFTAYLMDREKRVLSNLSSFFVKVMDGEKSVRLPFPEDSILILVKGTQERFMSTNALFNMDKDRYYMIYRQIGKDRLYMYVRKISLFSYIDFISRNIYYGGLILASILLYATVSYFTVKEFELSRGEPTGGITDDLMNKLKAFRLALATSKVIPEESISEMKRVLDGILKDKGSKSRGAAR